MRGRKLVLIGDDFKPDLAFREPLGGDFHSVTRSLLLNLDSGINKRSVVSCHRADDDSAARHLPASRIPDICTEQRFLVVAGFSLPFKSRLKPATTMILAC